MQLLGAKSLSMGHQGLLKLCMRERCVFKMRYQSNICTIFSRYTSMQLYEGLDAHPATTPVFTVLLYNFGV
jgi:hypothetical protein